MPLNLPFTAGRSEDPKLYEMLRAIGQGAVKSQDFASTYPVTLTRGTPGTPLTYGLSSPLLWPVHDFGGMFFDVKAYGARGDGTKDDTAAVNKALAAAIKAGGGIVYFPPGTYKVVQTGATVPFIITASNIWIFGAGRRASTISFVPATGGAVFQFNNAATQINYNIISGLQFTSTDTTTQKTAVLVRDCNNFIVREIAMADNEWKGASSIGVQFMGRQELRMRDCEIFSDLPVVIADNPNTAGVNEISFDHSSIECCDLAVTAGLTNPVVTINDGCVILNCQFYCLALLRGGGGIFFSNTTQATASQQIRIVNCRTEQSAGAAQYSIDLESTNGAIQSVAIENFACDNTIRGLKVRNVNCMEITNLVYNGTGEWLNLDNTSVPPYFRNCIINGAATKTLGATTRYFVYDKEHVRVFQTALPALSALSGLGTGTATVVANSSDYSGTIQLSPTGAPGAAGGVTFTFNRALGTQCNVVLTLKDGSGAWAPNSVVRTVATGNVNFSLIWTSTTGGAATNLTAGSTYNIDYMVLPKVA